MTIENVPIIVPAEIEPVITTDIDGNDHGFLRMTTPSGDVMNVQIASQSAACKLSAGLIELADALDASVY